MSENYDSSNIGLTEHFRNCALMVRESTNIARVAYGATFVVDGVYGWGTMRVLFIDDSSELLMLATLAAALTVRHFTNFAREESVAHLRDWFIEPPRTYGLSDRIIVWIGSKIKKDEDS